MKSWLIPALLLSCTSAWAYIPPSQFIVHTIAKKHSGYKSAVIKTTVSAMANGQPTDVNFKETTLFIFATGTLRSRATDATGQVLLEQERKVADLPLLPMILLDENAARIASALKAKAIPVQTDADFPNAAPNGSDVRDRMAAEHTSLVRWDNTIGWAIGDRDSASQLWVEKDTFLPLRLMFTGDGNDKVDLQMEHYRSTRQFFYPKTILWEKADKQPILQAEATELGIDQPGSDLAKKFSNAGLTDAGKAAPSALQDLLRAYYSVLR